MLARDPRAVIGRLERLLRDPDEAVRWYARGYYYEAKKKGLLEETGLRG